MAIFEDVTFTWLDRDYVLPASRLLKTIAAIEDVLTLAQLARHQAQGSVPMAKLAQAYGIMLRSAGAPFSDDQVYDGLFHDEDGNMQGRIMAYVVGLQMLMIPPAKLKANAKEVKATGENPQAGSSPSATVSVSGATG